ncbi:hypothetical protein BC833DRAFT_617668 [Globomyces pollinis-pini]|nr:hypothetical protein BC833DRAFT_617668 [Globomyces pollinis-pini]
MTARTGEELREACAVGNVKAVQFYLDNNYDPNGQNKVNGWTGLHWAYSRGNKEVVDLLLRNGANPKILNAKGQRPDELNKNVSESKPTTFVPNYLAAPDLSKLWDVPTTDHVLPSSQPTFKKTKPDSSSSELTQKKTVDIKEKSDELKISSSSEIADFMSSTREILVYNGEIHENKILGAIFLTQFAKLEDLKTRIINELDIIYPFTLLRVSRDLRIPIHEQQMNQSALLHFRNQDGICIIKPE